ncbi:hypothetical protein T484DRAFT_1786315, partial [Baffinella frigidus]
SVDYAHLAMRSDKDKFEAELVEAQDEFAAMRSDKDKFEAQLDKFEAELVEAQDELAGELASLMTVVNNFSKYSDLSKTKEIAENVAGINEKLKNCVYSDLSKTKEIAEDVAGINEKLKNCANAQLMNSRELQLERAPTDFNAPPHDLAKIQKIFEPFSQFWMAAAEWSTCHATWMDGTFTNLDPEEVRAL